MARIGLLVPSSNTTVEPEFYRALPHEATLHTARLFLAHISPETIAAMMNELETQSRLLASADVDIIVLGAVAPGFLKGLGYDRELAARIEAATGKRAITAATALIAALKHLGASRIAAGGPYDARVGAIGKSFLEANGIAVLATHELGLTDNLAVGRLGAETAYELGKKIDRPDAEAIVFAGTNMKTLDIVEKLERELSKPVVSTTAASLWAALTIIGGTESVPGYGRLLRDLTAPGDTTQLV